MNKKAVTTSTATLDSGITLGQRYLPAWNEVSQRISARQHVLTAYATAITAALLASLTAKGDNLLGYWPAVLLPWISLVCATWFIHHDLLIALLCAYLASCEDEDKAGLLLPCYYHEHGGFHDQAGLFRKDWIQRPFTYLQILSFVPALLVMYKLYHDDDFVKPALGPVWSVVFPGVAVVVGISTMYLIHREGQHRDRVRKGHVRRDGRNQPAVFYERTSA